jgi:leucyl-tRNA synthetase
MYTLFAAPPAKDLEWSEQGIEGCARFVQRVFRMVERHAGPLQNVSSAGAQTTSDASAKEKELQRKAHQTLRRVTQDFEERWHFNTSVALVMELVNLIYAQEPLEEGARPAVIKGTLELLTLMLAPIAPHLSEELWQMLGHDSTLARVGWPDFNAQLAEEEQIEIIIQINGRLRGKIRVETGLSKDELSELAVNDPKIAQLLKGQRIKQIIVVPNKLVNIVIGQN